MQDIIDRLRTSRNKTELLLLRQELDRKILDIQDKENKLEEKEELLTNDELNRAKSVEFVSQAYASYYNTTMEKDKSILTLSVAGLGFLITFINLSSQLGLFEYFIFIFAALSYLISIFSIITIFEKNADHIVAVVTDSDDSDRSGNELKKYDKRAIRSFYCGIVISLIFGLTTTFNKAIEVDNMTDKNVLNRVFVGDSVEGMSKMKPQLARHQQSKPTPSSDANNSNSKSSGDNSNAR
jgi:hypothetical protein